jgi:hypothetical protein
MRSMLKKLKRRILVAAGLHFDYEVSPHRVFLTEPQEPTKSAAKTIGRVDEYVPFKQSRLTGQGNPLRPPFHVETVLIGRALDQQTGYLYGIGFRVRDDGYVEAEFSEGVQKFMSMKDFKKELSKRRHLKDAERLEP